MASALEALFGRQQLTLIAGTCVIESEQLCLQVAHKLAQLCEPLGIPFIFKASFDKANRTSLSSFRGPGLEEGLRVLEKVKADVGVPVLTDVHEPGQVWEVAEVVDVLQIPAFLCRQTDLLKAAGETGCPVNVKKGQFLAPEDMKHVVGKLRGSGATDVAVTERGTSFGYHNLIVDMRGLETMAETTGSPVVFDATHSVQRPSAGDGFTSGDRRQALPLARAAVAVGVDGIFCEVHPSPDDALSDGPNALSFSLCEQLLQQVSALDRVRREVGA